MPDQSDPADKPVLYDLSTQKGRRAKAVADRQAKLRRNRAKHNTKQDAKRAKPKHKKSKSLTTTGMICKNLATTDDGLCYMHSKTEAERQLLVKQAQAVRKQAKLKPH